MVTEPTLPPYDAKAMCPKCGSGDLNAQYHKQGHSSYGCRRITRDEHVERHCRGCHYEWAEAPLDAKETTDGG